MKRPFLPAFLAFSALGSSPGADVLLEATTTTGEAGDAVVLQFRGTLSQPVAGFRIYFQLSEKIALFLRTEIFDTASFTPSANYLSLIDHATGAFITGVESTLI